MHEKKTTKLSHVQHTSRTSFRFLNLWCNVNQLTQIPKAAENVAVTFTTLLIQTHTLNTTFISLDNAFFKSYFTFSVRRLTAPILLTDLCFNSTYLFKHLNSMHTID